jgi:hypothetical protein
MSVSHDLGSTAPSVQDPLVPDVEPWATDTGGGTRACWWGSCYC